MTQLYTVEDDPQLHSFSLYVTWQTRMDHYKWHPIFPYGYECWAVTERDVLNIDALHQQCLWKLLEIKW